MAQALTDADPSSTVLSIRQAMLEGMRWVEGDSGVVHTVTQAKGGEQCDTLLPALFSLGQHPALEVIYRRLQFNERLLGFLGRHLCSLSCPSGGDRRFCKRSCCTIQ